MLQVPKWQILLVAAVLLAGAVFAAPNLLGRQTTERWPDWVPSQQINLGLDLQGGSYLLLEVDVDSVIQEQLQSLVEDIRSELRQARIGYTDLGVEGIAAVFTLRKPERAQEVRNLLAGLPQDVQLEVDEATGQARLTYTEQSLRQRTSNAVQQSIEIIRRRIDETGVREPSIQRQGERRILVQLPGIRDPERMKEIIGKTAKLTFRFVDEDVRLGRDPVPPGAVVLPSAEATADGQAVRRYVVRKRVMVSGENLVDAQATFQDNQPVVSFRFNAVGAKRFADATKENVGRLFAIVLDGKVISAPVIREPILGGSGIISGSFTVQQAQDLALLLRAGALPAPLKILEERSVGPGLGADSVRAGKIASILGLVFVVALMAGIYGFFGLLADIALVANLILIVAVLSGLQATLTLPGIAGIVLTIGMAVDANVLIFERIREEVENQRGTISAIDAGYRRALTTIIDANVTTLIAAVILYYFGSGPIRGFAVTLAIGLVTSMFTAIMVTRLMVIGWLRRRRPQALPI